MLIRFINISLSFIIHNYIMLMLDNNNLLKCNELNVDHSSYLKDH